MAMPSEIRSRVEAIPGVNSELVLRELPTVEMSMQLNLYHKVAKFKEVVTDKTLYGVELMAEELYRVSYEPVVDPNELTDLHQQVRDLFDDVADATIDARLKDVLSHHLRAMDSAIQEVRIRGASGLRDVADMSLGAIIVVAHSEEVQRDEKGAGRSACTWLARRWRQCWVPAQREHHGRPWGRLRLYECPASRPSGNDPALAAARASRRTSSGNRCPWLLTAGWCAPGRDGGTSWPAAGPGQRPVPVSHSTPDRWARG